MPRYYQFGGRPPMYEADWQGWPLPAVQNASELSNYVVVGDAVPLPMGGVIETLNSRPVRLGAGAAMAYHGYRRTNSGLWSVLWSVFGAAAPWLAAPIALAQGFGRAKVRKNPKKRPRLSTLKYYVSPQKKKAKKKKARLRTAAGKRRSAAAKKGWKKRKRQRK